MLDPLAASHCAPCDKSTPPLPPEEVDALLREVPGWKLAGRAITRSVSFPDFRTAFAFLGKVAELAETENHHPDFTLHDWNKVDLTVSTHAIGGLSRNDFILAARINQALE